MFFTPTQLKKLQNSGYKVFNHSAVKLCHWTKESIKTGEKKFCYKQKFYGIKSHRCLQMTPSLPWCNLRCTYCWRNINISGEQSEPPIDRPEQIIEKSIQAQRELLSGLGGVSHSEKHLKEAQNPNQVAISLEGEPTLYPYLSNLIQEFKKRKFTKFLVTNGTNPRILEKMQENRQLPYQLYLSLSSPNKKIFNSLQHPINNNISTKSANTLWTNINKTITLFPSLNTRKVIRLTLIRHLNTPYIKEYSKIIQTAHPDFIEVKAWMAVGASRLKIPYSYMFSHEEIQEFSKNLADKISYKYADEQKESRVVLLKR